MNHAQCYNAIKQGFEKADDLPSAARYLIIRRILRNLIKAGLELDD